MKTFCLLFLPPILMALFVAGIIHEEEAAKAKKQNFYRVIQKKIDRKQELEKDPFKPLSGEIEI